MVFAPSLFASVTVFFLCCARNDVWRYQQWPGITKGLTKLIFRGFGFASVLMVFTIAADKMFGLKRELHHPHHKDEHSMHDWQTLCVIVDVFLSLKVTCCGDLCRLCLVEKHVVRLAEKFMIKVCDLWLSDSWGFGSSNLIEC